MISIEKPGSPEEMLEHFGTKGMKWGVRRAVDKSIGTKTAGRRPVSKSLTPAQREHRKQVAKKVAIGAAVVAVLVGTAYVAYRLNKAGKLPLSSRGSSSGGRTFKNIDEAIAAKRKTTAILKTKGHNPVPDAKLLADHQEELKRMAKGADWSKDWNAVFKATHGVSASQHKESLIKWS